MESRAGRTQKNERGTAQKAAVQAAETAPGVPSRTMPSSDSERQVGLARALSKLGYCSRAKASALIRSGHVRLNGRVRRDPETPVHLHKDRIEVSGEMLSAAERVYFALNKPRGIVTTASDEKGRATVYSLLKPEERWISPVGRLDRASEGLLLLTNDSEWAARVLAPETHLEKTYHVQVEAVADDTLLQAIRRGVKTPEGDFLHARTARVVRGGKRNTWLEIVLDEGKNRHIRRMLKELNIDVQRLIRIAIGPMVLGDLKKGQYRALTLEEKKALDDAMQRN